MTTIGRRRFLVLGAVATGSLAVGSLTLGGCGLFGGEGTWEAMFGDQLPGVREVGLQGISSGLVPTLDDALQRLPADLVEVRVDGDGQVTSVEVDDPEAFVAETTRLVQAELDRDDFVSLSGYPLTPTEVSFAVLVRVATD